MASPALPLHLTTLLSSSLSPLIQRPTLSTLSISSNFIYKQPSFFSPKIFHKKSDRNYRLIVKSQLNTPLISPQDHWGTWTALLATGTFGLWSEKTKIGSTVSAALVSILIGLAASNLGIIPYEAPAYSIVFQYLLPLTVPLLLFRADLRQVIQSTGTLFQAFLLGSDSINLAVADTFPLILQLQTVVGTTVAFLMVPMRSLGQDNWKIASALMGSYIGGAINYVAISEALSVSPSVVAAGVAADNVICAVYFVVLFALASKIPSEASTSTNDASTAMKSEENKHSVLKIATALFVSFAICKAATSLTKLLGIQGGDLPAITAIVVVLATSLPSYFCHLAPAGEAFAVVLMQLLQFDSKLLLLASNANIGGPTTACGMATAKGWGSLVVPGILIWESRFQDEDSLRALNPQPQLRR
ncbi:hypothetical protein Fot_00853 [Forsythia ovata]|uniref:Uncharacterized protein n=1 Tax=Forsythia ovata TaxID=205694 RepID=A0ABD1X2J4_9LAMI